MPSVVESGHKALTSRQNEVVDLLMRGATDADIATHLGISMRTASRHVFDVLLRLNADTRAHAVAIVMRERAQASVEVGQS